MRNRVKELRLQRGMTQEEFAERVAVSRQTIISIESGRYNPSILLAFKIARVFGLSIEDTFLCAEQEK
ncbi:MAG TPA: helix-turn-helix transcriptional regulator [Armatimonadota bacterium]